MDGIVITESNSAGGIEIFSIGKSIRFNLKSVTEFFSPFSTLIPKWLISLFSIYKVNVSDYIDEVLQRGNLKFIEHLNMNKLNFSNIDIEKIYRKGDLGSHLNDEFHQKLFIKNIVSNL